MLWPVLQGSPEFLSTGSSKSQLESTNMRTGNAYSRPTAESFAIEYKIGAAVRQGSIDLFR